MRRLYLPGGAVVVLVVLPFVLPEHRTLQLAAVGAYFIAIVGLALLTRPTGQVSLGHGALMTVGGYTTAILMAHHGVRDLWTIPAAAVVAGAVGLALGLIAGRLLALATFGVALALPTLVGRFDRFTGGSAGITLRGVPRHSWRYALTWAIAVALFLVARGLLSSRWGRATRAARDSELAAASSGINRSGYRVAAFGVSAAYAGVAGALYAIDVAHVDPHTYSIELSLFLVAGVVVGGYGSIWGAALGALVVEFLPGIVGTLPHMDPTRSGPATFIYGAAVIAVVLAVHIARKVSAR